MDSSEIRPSRIEALMTVRELSRLSEVSESSIYKIEHGKAHATELTLARLGKVLQEKRGASKDGAREKERVIN